MRETQCPELVVATHGLCPNSTGSSSPRHMMIVAHAVREIEVNKGPEFAGPMVRDQDRSMDFIRAISSVWADSIVFASSMASVLCPFFCSTFAISMAPS